MCRGRWVLNRESLGTVYGAIYASTFHDYCHPVTKKPCSPLPVEVVGEIAERRLAPFKEFLELHHGRVRPFNRELFEAEQAILSEMRNRILQTSRKEHDSYLLSIWRG
jgi:hypothetical protein